jgi:hypothetical protein
VLGLEIVRVLEAANASLAAHGQPVAIERPEAEILGSGPAAMNGASRNGHRAEAAA